VALDPRAIHIYTDGSCFKNPGGKSGAAAVVQYPDHLALEDQQILDFGAGRAVTDAWNCLRVYLR